MSFEQNLNVIEIPAGDNPQFQINVFADGTAMDLTGSTVTLTVLASPDYEDAVLFTLDNASNGGVAVLSPADLGVCIVTMSNDQRALLVTQTLPFFRIIVTQPDGRPSTIMSGYFLFTP